MRLSPVPVRESSADWCPGKTPCLPHPHREAGTTAGSGYVRFAREPARNGVSPAQESAAMVRPAAWGSAAFVLPRFCLRTRALAASVAVRGPGPGQAEAGKSRSAGEYGGCVAASWPMAGSCVRLPEPSCGVGEPFSTVSSTGSADRLPCARMASSKARRTSSGRLLPVACR
jgi:hypothetical protein